MPILARCGDRATCATRCKSIVYLSNPYPTIPLLQPSKVVFAFGTARFYVFYADLLTRPVPVRDNDGQPGR